MLIGLAFCLVQFVPPLLSGQKLVLSQQQIDSLMAIGQTRHITTKKASSVNAEPLDADIQPQTYDTFYFDPNTADTTMLLRLGLPRWMIHSMLKYRAAGGRYSRTDDLKRVPGMTPEIYERIAPYVTIDSKFKPYDPVELALERQNERLAVRRTIDSIEHATLPHKLKAGERLDLNSADSASLCTVPGIAGYRARAIINYRGLLGGFVDVKQLADITEVPDSCSVWFYVDSPHPQQININSTSLSRLSAHPYIGKRRAALIVEYRRRHGSICSLEDLSLHPEFSDSILQRIKPYICFQ